MMMEYSEKTENESSLFQQFVLQSAMAVNLYFFFYNDEYCLCIHTMYIKL